MARAPIHTPANFLTSRSLEPCYLRRYGCLRPPFLSQTLRPVPASKLVIVRGCVIAGYARKSVDSDGFDQLTDDNDFTVYSSHELPYDGDVTVDNEDIKNSGTPRRISIGRLGRLKSQKVKAIVMKGSRTKEEVKDDVRVLTSGNGSPHISDRPHSKVKTPGEKKKVNTLRNVERFSRSSELQDKGRHHRTPPSLSRSEQSVPAASATHFRGWGSRGPYDSEYESTQPKQQKFSSEKGFYSRKSFKDLGCTEYMIESLRRQNFLRPSQIQAKAFASVIEGKSCIISDQSGSGKTLAYLAPLIQRLRQEELQGLQKPSSQSPQIVIIVPTAELASQVLSNCRSISKFGVPFRSMVVTGGFRPSPSSSSIDPPPVPPVVAASSPDATTELTIPALAAVGSEATNQPNPNPTPNPNRCSSCRKKVGLTGFRCRCGITFCGAHRYPEKHGCTFDFKSIGREEIARANPIVKADKLERI